MNKKGDQKIIDEAVRQWLELMLAHIRHKRELEKQQVKNNKKRSNVPRIMIKEICGYIGGKEYIVLTAV